MVTGRTAVLAPALQLLGLTALAATANMVVVPKLPRYCRIAARRLPRIVAVVRVLFKTAVPAVIKPEQVRELVPEAVRKLEPPKSAKVAVQEFTGLIMIGELAPVAEVTPMVIVATKIGVIVPK